LIESRKAKHDPVDFDACIAYMKTTGFRHLEDGDLISHNQLRKFCYLRKV
jgi:hypothetical protein